MESLRQFFLLSCKYGHVRLKFRESFFFNEMSSQSQHNAMKFCNILRIKVERL